MWSKSIELLNPYEALKEAQQKERAVKYGCDGVCYTDTEICPRAEVCHETRAAESRATAMAALTVLIAPVAVAIAIIYCICSIL